VCPLGRNSQRRRKIQSCQKQSVSTERLHGEKEVPSFLKKKKGEKRDADPCLSNEGGVVIPEPWDLNSWEEIQRVIKLIIDRGGKNWGVITSIA